ncbi:hypothetical protein C0J52_14604 [Blattella germanica]|nr:hypothetical protein C0J52_14604 [Blattella germanica]
MLHGSRDTSRAWIENHVGISGNVESAKKSRGIKEGGGGFLARMKQGIKIFVMKIKLAFVYDAGYRTLETTNAPESQPGYVMKLSSNSKYLSSFDSSIIIEYDKYNIFLVIQITFYEKPNLNKCVVEDGTETLKSTKINKFGFLGYFEGKAISLSIFRRENRKNVNIAM